MRPPAQTAAAAAAAALLVLAAACGGGSDAPQTMDAWRARHGADVREVGTVLDRTQAATKDGEPTGIRSSCELLRDTATEARSALPVPDGSADAALRKALDGVSTGALDCVRASAMGDARLLERSITELREARLQLDTANAALSA